MSIFPNNDFIEKEVTLSIRVPENFDAAMERRIDEAIANVLYNLGCELVDSKEYRDITAPSVRHIDFGTLKFRDFDDTGIPLQFFFGCEAPETTIQKIAQTWGYRGDLCTDIAVCVDLYSPDERPIEAVLTFSDGEQRWVDLRSDKEQVDKLIDIASQADSDRTKEALRAYQELFEPPEASVDAGDYVDGAAKKNAIATDVLSTAGSSLIPMYKVTFLSGEHPGQCNQFDVYIPASKDGTADKADVFLSEDERILAYEKATAIVGDDAISDYVIHTAAASAGIWFTVYKDTLGFPDDFDNLTEICVPAEWFAQNLDLDGCSLEDWFDEYIADDTEALAAKALADGVILDCASKEIDITCLNRSIIKPSQKPSLSDQIGSASRRSNKDHTDLNSTHKPSER